MKKIFMAVAMAGLIGSVPLFAQGMEVDIGLGWNNSIMINKATFNDVTISGQSLKDQADETASNFALGLRLYMMPLGSADFGFSILGSIGFPYSYEFAVPQEAGGTPVTYSKKDGTILDFGMLLGVSYRQRLFGTIGLVLDAGLSIHSKSINILKKNAGSGYTLGTDYYEDFNYNLSDTTIGIGASAGVQVHFGMFFAEAGFSVSYDMGRTIEYKGWWSKNSNPEDKSPGYSSEDPAFKSSDAEKASKFYFGAPYILVGIRF
ncbi:hypothetical protein FACS1894172_19680 [Spirochaetia bacterium]|nr:hypothetical protein FACS1894164_16600 [Spirochaetia bacterium]GHU36649.1 hypothetical protein FACS1894172_19680 [Spirochaetia bacterium]